MLNLREGGDIGLFITLISKFYNNVFSFFLAQQPWGLLLNFDWFLQSVEFPNVSTNNCNLPKG